MKIAVFHELHQGGARRVVNELAKYLKKNHEVDLYYVDEEKNTDEEMFFSNQYFYPFNAEKWRGNNWRKKLYKDTLELNKVRLLHKTIAGDINEREYDIIVVHPSKFTQAPFILQFLTGKKVYYCHETLRIVYEKQFALKNDINLGKKLYEKINRLQRKLIDKSNIAYADVILTNSEFTKRNVKIAYGKTGIVSYFGVDTAVFRKYNTKKNIDILFIGTKEVTEGYPLLKEAALLLKKKCTIHVHAFGIRWIKDRELAELYSRSKVVICLSNNEPFGLIPLEAMACGVPVIALNEGGYKETVIDGRTGFLIEPRAKVLAEKIDMILSSPGMQESLSRNAYLHIQKNWKWEKRIKDIERLFTNIAL